MKHTLFFCIAAALTLAACTKDDENLDSGPVAAQVTAGIGWAQTRASGTAWSARRCHRHFPRDESVIGRPANNAVRQRHTQKAGQQTRLRLPAVCKSPASRKFP